MSSLSESLGFQQAELAPSRESLESPDALGPAGFIRPPAPGEESAGPALTDLVYELREFVAAERLLRIQAQAEARLRRYQEIRTPGQTDGTTGNLTLKLFEVPQGATAYVQKLIIEMEGRNPQTTSLSNVPWAVLADQQPTAPGVMPPAGALLHCIPDHTERAFGGTITIPSVYDWNDLGAAPSVQGPKSVYFVLSGGNVAALLNKQMVIGINVLIEQPNQ